MTLAGYTDDGNDYVWKVVKLDANRGQIWTYVDNQTYTGELKGMGMTEDGDSILFGGDEDSAGLVKVDADGNLVWRRDDSITMVPGGLAVHHENGTIFLAGYNESLDGTENPAAVGLNADGTPVWSWQNGTSEDDQLYAAVVVEDSGALIVAGYTYGNWSGPAKGQRDCVAVSLAIADGSERWRWQGGSEDGEVILAGAAGDNGSVVLAGWTRSDWYSKHLSGRDFVALKLHADGSFAWGWQDGTDGDDTITGVAVSGEIVWLTGETEGDWDDSSAGGTDAAIVALSLDDGSELLRWQNGTSGEDGLNSCVLSSDDALVVAGYTNESWSEPNAGESDFLAVAWNASISTGTPAPVLITPTPSSTSHSSAHEYTMAPTCTMTSDAPVITPTSQATGWPSMATSWTAATSCTPSLGTVEPTLGTYAPTATPSAPAASDSEQADTTSAVGIAIGVTSAALAAVFVCVMAFVQVQKRRKARQRRRSGARPRAVPASAVVNEGDCESPTGGGPGRRAPDAGAGLSRSARNLMRFERNPSQNRQWSIRPASASASPPASRAKVSTKEEIDHTHSVASTIHTHTGSSCAISVESGIIRAGDDGPAARRGRPAGVENDNSGDKSKRAGNVVGNAGDVVDGMNLADAVLDAAQYLAERCNIPFIGDAAALVSVLVSLVRDSMGSLTTMDWKLKRCRSIIVMLAKAEEILGKGGDQLAEAESILLEDVHDAIKDVVELFKTFESKNRMGQVIASSLFKRRQEEAEAAVDAALSRLQFGMQVQVGTRLNEVGDKLDKVAQDIHGGLRVRSDETKESPGQGAASSGQAAGAGTAKIAETRRARRQRRLEQIEIPQDQLLITDELLGRGGFGSVFLADYSGTNAAAKVLLIEHELSTGDEGDEDDAGPNTRRNTVAAARSRRQRKAFLRELETMVRLKSPHTVQVYGAITSARDRLVLVMELLAGGDLRSLLRDAEKPLQHGRMREIMKDVCAGMVFLHGKEVVHGDLKSANVLFDAGGRAKIADFGTSRWAQHTGSTGFFSSTMKESEGTQLSFAWAAPEVLDGASPSYAGDVYSFGVLAWEVVSRKLPWARARPTDIMVRVLNGHRPLIPHTSPRDVAQIIRTCWDGDPTKRPTAADIVKRIRTTTD